MEPEPKSGVTKYVVGIVIVVIIILGVSLMGNNQPKNEAPQNPPETAPANTGPSAAANPQNNPIATPTTVTFTMADVAAHNNKDSCYTAIRGSVYDLTSFIYQHPGGAARILALCGIDGTSAFEGKHSGQARPEAELISLKIGELAK